MLERKLSTSSSSRSSEAKRPRLDTVAKSQGTVICVHIFLSLLPGFADEIQLLEFVLQELPILVDSSDLHAAQV